ncbi:MAG TPA: DNA adenine methylase [Nitrososphaeraceae archaeon]|jgi:DNA adenine methylase
MNQSIEILPLKFDKLYPFVKWAGGKSQLLSVIDKTIPEYFGRYFEPFLGGGAVFLHMVNKNRIHTGAILSDLNEELINAYNVARSNVEMLIEILTTYEQSYKISPARFYYYLRDSFTPTSNKAEWAARFITLNKTCYNGLYRVNKQGRFNVPMGRYKSPCICDLGNLRNISNVLRDRHIRIELGDYKRILLENAKEGDFVYLDPPYDPMSATARFTGYTYTGFNDKDQCELAELFKKLDERKCLILLSNSHTPLIKELYQNYKYIKKISTTRAINSNASKRSGHTELLISNYRI